MRVVVFRDFGGDLWCGQGIERDIAVQSRTLAGISREFAFMLRAYRHLERHGKRGPGRPPAYAIRKPGHRIRVELPVRRRKWNS